MQLKWNSVEMIYLQNWTRDYDDLETDDPRRHQFKECSLV